MRGMKRIREYGEWNVVDVDVKAALRVGCDMDSEGTTECGLYDVKSWFVDGTAPCEEFRLDSCAY